MKAVVKLINQPRGMYGAQTEGGEFVIFELLDTQEPEIGDVVSHADFYAMGDQDYRNETQKLSIAVYVQNVVNTLAQAKKQCFLQ